MCGGITYNLEKIPDEELNKFYTKKQIDSFKNKKIITSFFWDKQPILPILKNRQCKLFEWGNRDKKIKLPLTGWARIESVKNNKWGWLKPEKVKIPAIRGYEKKVWFDFKNGTNGILVNKNNIKRVYMLTNKADKIYLKNTNHNRMPIGIKNNFKNITTNK